MQSSIVIITTFYILNQTCLKTEKQCQKENRTQHDKHDPSTTAS